MHSDTDADRPEDNMQSVISEHLLNLTEDVTHHHYSTYSGKGSRYRPCPSANLAFSVVSTPRS